MLMNYKKNNDLNVKQKNIHMAVVKKYGGSVQNVKMNGINELIIL